LSVTGEFQHLDVILREFFSKIIFIAGVRSKLNVYQDVVEFIKRLSQRP
jgi:hypothetical protein